MTTTDLGCTCPDADIALRSGHTATCPMRTGLVFAGEPTTVRTLKIIASGPWEFRQVGPDTWAWVAPSTEPVPGVDVTGAALIAAERRRQVDVEGWTPDHDRGHGPMTMMNAAYAYRTGNRLGTWPSGWVWKPKNALRDLVRAGALYQAAADIPGIDPLLVAQAEAARDVCARAIDELLDEARYALGGGAR